MKTIIDKKSGRVLYATDGEFVDTKTEIAIDVKLVDFMVKPYFNFETQTYYETATAEEIEQYKIDFLIE